MRLKPKFGKEGIIEDRKLDQKAQILSSNIYSSIQECRLKLKTVALV